MSRICATINTAWVWPPQRSGRVWLGLRPGLFWVRLVSPRRPGFAIASSVKGSRRRPVTTPSPGCSRPGIEPWPSRRAGHTRALIWTVVGPLMTCYSEIRPPDRTALWLARPARRRRPPPRRVTQCGLPANSSAEAAEVVAGPESAGLSRIRQTARASPHSLHYSPG